MILDASSEGADLDYFTLLEMQGKIRTSPQEKKKAANHSLGNITYLLTALLVIDN